MIFGRRDFHEGPKDCIVATFQGRARRIVLKFLLLLAGEPDGTPPLPFYGLKRGRRPHHGLLSLAISRIVSTLGVCRGLFTTK